MLFTPNFVTVSGSHLAICIASELCGADLSYLSHMFAPAWELRVVFSDRPIRAHWPICIWMNLYLCWFWCYTCFRPLVSCIFRSPCSGPLTNLYFNVFNFFSLICVCVWVHPCLHVEHVEQTLQTKTKEYCIDMLWLLVLLQNVNNDLYTCTRSITFWK